MRNIILATGEHIPSVASLEAATFADPTSEGALMSLMSTEGAFCAACVEGEELIGFCTVVTVLDEAQIINVATDARHKRQGIASDVLRFVLDECRGRGIISISLEVRESNEAAKALYRAHGFAVAGTRRDFYKNPRENALVMVKNLD